MLPAKIDVVPFPLAQQRSHDTQVISTPARRLFGERRAEVRGHLAQVHAPFPIRFWHLASFDAPTIALVWCMAFAWAMNVTLPSWLLALIPLGVWSVYISDRLLDARGCERSLDLDQLRDRHVFHWRHRRLFIPSALVSGIAALFMVCKWMPLGIREHDSLLAAASLLYFARVHSKRADFALLSKEFLVGILFTLGCVLPAWWRVQFSSGVQFWSSLATSAAFGLLAWLNCAAIDRWESDGGFTKAGNIARGALILSSISCFCAFLLAPTFPRFAALLGCAALSALLIAALDRIRNQLTPVTLRAAADIALLTPAIALAMLNIHK